MNFSSESLKKLITCDLNLRLVFENAIQDSPYDFKITCGYRPPEEQRKLYHQGRTKPGNIVTNCDGYIKKGKHNYLPSKAVDIAIFVNDKLTWDEKYYKKVATHVLKKAKELGIKIMWGGNWKNFKDLPHFEID